MHMNDKENNYFEEENGMEEVVETASSGKVNKPRKKKRGKRKKKGCRCSQNGIFHQRR